MSTKKTKEETMNMAAFRKEQLLRSSRYSDYKDIISVILSNDATYTFEEVDRRLDEFMKGKVSK